MWVQEQQKVAPLRFGTWNSDVDPGVNGTWLTCDGFLSRYCNPKVDELWQQQAATYDLEQRAKLVSELLKLVHDDAPQVYLYPVFEFYGVSKRVQGFEPSTNALLRVFNATVQ